MESISMELRQAVLQAAMQGKLTKQFSNETIDDIKKSLCYDKKINPINDVPFEIPSNWEWVQIGNLGQSIDTNSFSDGPFGSNLKKQHQIDKPEVRIIQLSNIGEDGWRNENVKYTSFKHLEEVIPRCEVQPGDFVIAKMMPAGRTIEVPNLGTRITLGSDAMKFKPNSVLNKKYLLYAMRSLAFLEQVYAGAHGITRVRTTLKGIKSYVLPIPPLAEQKRIVARVDELMAKIDELEKVESELRSLHQAFPNDMKASLLQAAMQGKLTEQLPEDGNNLKKYYDKHILDNDLDVPINWAVLRLKDVASHQNGKAFKPSDWKSNGLKIIRIQNLTDINSSVNYCEPSIVEDKFIINNNDILVSWSCTIDAFKYRGSKAALNQHIFKVVFDKEIDVLPEFYVYCIKSLLSLINSQRHGSTMTHITKTDYEKLLFPLPPPAEQERIVEKLDRLLPLCDSLQTEL